MGNRGEALADKFEQELAKLVEAIEQYPDASWQKVCGDEGWTVAATAHHVGHQWSLERELLDGTVGNAPMPSYSWDDVNARNEQHAQEFSGVSKDAVIAYLREGATGMASYVRGLSDEQLERRAAFPLANGAEVNAQALIEGGVLIDHITAHLKSIQAVA